MNHVITPQRPDEELRQMAVIGLEFIHVSAYV